MRHSFWLLLFCLSENHKICSCVGGTSKIGICVSWMDNNLHNAIWHMTNMEWVVLFYLELDIFHSLEHYHNSWVRKLLYHKSCLRLIEHWNSIISTFTVMSLSYSSLDNNHVQMLASFGDCNTAIKLSQSSWFSVNNFSWKFLWSWLIITVNMT